MITLLVIVAVWYISTHGFIAIGSSGTNKTTTKYYSVNSDLEVNPGESSDTRILLPSGDYLVQRPDGFGGFTIQNATAPRWLTTTSLQPQTAGFRTTAISKNSLLHVGLRNNKVISYRDDTYRSADTKNITNDNIVDKSFVNYPGFNSSIQIGSEKIGGFVETPNGFQPTIYDINKETIKTFAFVNDYVDTGLIAIHDGFGYLDKKNNVVFLYTSDTVQEISLKGLNVSFNADEALFSYSNGKIAVVTGLSLVLSGDDEPEDAISDKQKIFVFDTETKNIEQQLNFGDTFITGVSLSPNGQFIAVQTPDSTSVINIVSKKQVHTIPFSTSDLTWVENNTIVVNTANDGIMLADINEKTTKSIVPYSLVKPTKVSFIKNGMVYFTGYKANVRGKVNANIYSSVIKTNSTDQKNYAVIENFPYQGRDYYIDIYNNTITVQRTRYVSNGNATVSKEALNRAKQYAQDKLGDSLKKYTYNLTYTDLILDPEN